MSLQAVVKNIQDIMRQDAGVDGDAQRLSQIVWMLFLKIFDDQEEQLELTTRGYKSPIPEKLRWRSWAKDAEGMTGEELLLFINNELFPGLKNLSVDPRKDPRGFIVREVFADAYNYMKTGTLIRQVVNKLNEVDFNKKDDRHHFNEVYEHMLKELQAAGNAGEYYTPRPLTQFIVEMVAPTLGERILDPACGTGGFLVDALQYVRKQEVKNAADEKKLQASIRGTELKNLPHMLAITNLILHGVEVPSGILRDDSLARPLADIAASGEADVIFANPPFGGVVKEGAQKHFPADLRTKETALLFLVLFVRLLSPRGRAGIVLPDGVLFGEGAAGRIKEKLLAECNVHTIVRLPPGVFSPYAGVNTNLVFFEKGSPTKEIWYYQMPLPEGVRAYTKGRPIQHGEFDAVRKSLVGIGGADIKKRKEGPQMWKVSIEDIKARNYNLDFKNPNGPAAAAHKTPKEILVDIESREKRIFSLLEGVRKEIDFKL